MARNQNSSTPSSTIWHTRPSLRRSDLPNRKGHSLRPLVLALILAASPASATRIAGEGHLTGLEGQPAPAPLSITFTNSGAFSGQAPCNHFFGTKSGTLPALTLGTIGSTRMACPDLAAESVYFLALEAMQSAEVTDNRLFLIGPEGRVMECIRDPATDSTCLSCLK